MCVVVTVCSGWLSHFMELMDAGNQGYNILLVVENKSNCFIIGFHKDNFVVNI